MHVGRIVFAQLMDHLLPYAFQKCVAPYSGDYKFRGFSCLDQFLCLAFAQLTFRESLRDIEACLSSVESKLYHMGFRGKVSRSFRGLWPGSAAGTGVTVAGVVVEAVPLRHGATENLGYRIGMGGRVLTHVGDAEAEQGSFEILLAKGPTDVALVPFWWLLGRESLQFIRERWKPRAVIAIHFGKADAAESASKMRDGFPGTWVCIKPGESRVY